GAALLALLPPRRALRRRARRARPPGVHLPAGLGGPLPRAARARGADAPGRLPRRELSTPRPRHDRGPHGDRMTPVYPRDRTWLLPALLDAQHAEGWLSPER